MNTAPYRSHLGGVHAVGAWAGPGRGLRRPLGGSRSGEGSRRSRFSGKGEGHKPQKKVWAGLAAEVRPQGVTTISQRHKGQ